MASGSIACTSSLLASLLILAACGSGGDDTEATCEPAWVPPEGIEQCDQGRDRRCLHADADGDGLSVAQGDCDDQDPGVLDGPECEAIPIVPPPGDCSAGPYCDLDGDGYTPAMGDCDDEDAKVFPGALETCGDEIDQDCDGFDLSCEDADQDGDGVTPAEGDCDDGDPLASSNAVEICGDGIDNDCQGGDLPCDKADQDEDGYTPDEGDCDDARADVHPGALEVCGDKIDNDCDGKEDDKNCPVRADSGPVDLTLSSDEPIQLTLTAALPDPRAGEVGGDIMFLVDLTASYEDDIGSYRFLAKEITTSLSEAFQDLRIGLAGFRDAPCDGHGDESMEWAYHLFLPLTDDLDRFTTAVDALTTAGGSSHPEAALEGMYQALTGAGYAVASYPNCRPAADIATTQPGWSAAGRIPLLLVSTDAPFNRPGDALYPYPTTVERVIDTATDMGVSVFFLATGDSDPDEVTIAKATGGAQYQLADDSRDIVVALGQVLDKALQDIVVDLVPDEAGAAFVDKIEPASIEGVNLLVDDTVSFEVTFKRTLTPKTHEQVIEFDLVLRARGGAVDRLPVRITIPGVDV
jgi:hypothetical protein